MSEQTRRADPSQEGFARSLCEGLVVLLGARLRSGSTRLIAQLVLTILTPEGFFLLLGEGPLNKNLGQPLDLLQHTRRPRDRFALG
jgi:hypothetical protein